MLDIDQWLMKRPAKIIGAAGQKKSLELKRPKDCTQFT